jgi:hypothetical protein
MKVGAEIKEGIRISIDAIRGNLLRSGLTTIGNSHRSRDGDR